MRSDLLERRRKVIERWSEYLAKGASAGDEASSGPSRKRRRFASINARGDEDSERAKCDVPEAGERHGRHHRGGPSYLRTGARTDTARSLTYSKSTVGR